MFQLDLIGVDGRHSTQANHALDSTEHGHFSVTEDGAVVRLRHHVRIKSPQLAGGFQSGKDILDGVGQGYGLGLVGDALAERCEEVVAGLEVGAVQDPRIPGDDPADPIGIRSILEKPDAGVHTRLACSDDHDSRRRPAQRVADRCGGTQATPGAMA